MYFMGNMEIKQNYKVNLKIMKEVCVCVCGTYVDLFNNLNQKEYSSW